ncbi:heme lyase CcmF/NrfE family subunit [Methyloceanibacter sp.]|uniref:heme lyase CcmF/NrfE family subunit n=1 Tax=Methyloceanibacter sp. TaxID=1965321 RepID=UPI002BEDA07D|nr:heme lyase CcmF/NrfE family subunit [Methyloceanibacter sp.]HML92302.1 heme lyase CcmF/NrfE family subunit [Methyloceanibacter sp.]
MSGSVIELGMVATALSLVLAIVCIAASIYGASTQQPVFNQVARQALLANFVLVTLGCFTVVWSFVQNDFSVAYVAQNSNTHLPLIYRLTALWGAHEGSLLLWLWFLTLYSALVVLFHWKTHPRSMPYVMATLAAVQVGFQVLILFLSSPFTELIPAPAEGRELNPLLQDPGLIIHPPMLYLGYVGFVVPFAFAVAALIRGNAGAEWVVATRRWTLFAWLALTSGIMLGGYWAYYELGWGGYWAWDPVENASLMPWLTGTALLHSIMAQENRNLFRSWNAFLAITTFALSLLGTFLVRSGVLTSVHAFAVDPTRGTYLLAFLGIVTLGGFGLLIFRADTLRSNARLDGSLSRESTLLFNNLFLVVATATVFLGTLYPLAVEVMADERITVAAPYFNKTVLPIMVAIVWLMAIGPVVPWRKSNLTRLRKLMAGPICAALVCLLTGWFFGVRALLPLLALAGIGCVLASIALDTWRSTKARIDISGKSWFAGLIATALWNRRRYGGFIVHLGVTIVVFGILASGLFQETKTVAVAPGEQFKIGAYTLTFDGLEQVQGPNWAALQANVQVFSGPDDAGLMQPQRRTYPRGGMTTTESAIRSTFSGDLYLVVGEELGGGRASLRAYFIPLVGWIWVGWLVMIVGSLFALSQARTYAAPARTAPDVAEAANP